MLDLHKISGKAHYEAHTWGRHSSPTSKFFYTLIRALRFFSLLQIIKFIHRSLKARSVKNTSRTRLDRKSRLDFHAFYTEVYILSVMTSFIVLYILASHSVINSSSIALRIISLYFFVESAVWIIYYMLFRILMEKKLTIYDEAEYLIMFPVVIIIQLFTLSLIIPGSSPVTILGLVFNIGSVTYSGSQIVSVILGMLGVLYIAAIIASLINIIPKIPVWRRPNVTVIGAGDVVINRILPTLRNLYSSKQIAVAADYISEDLAQELNRAKIKYLSVYKTRKNTIYSHEERTFILQKITSFISSRSSYAVIATPSDEHFAYIMALANEKIKFAVEKPICTAQPHVKALLSSSSELMREGFLLSYYILEKSLPLVYFLTLNPAYRDLLKIQSADNTLDSPSAFSMLKKELGAEKMIVVEFLEQDETEDRYWTEIPETGGMVTETFIHTLSIVRAVIEPGTPISFDKELWIRNKDRLNLIYKKHKREIGPTYVDIIARSGNCNIRMRTGKYTSHKKRRMEVMYEYGRIICDFDKQNCLVYKDNDEKPCLEIDLKFKGKYETQMLLFHEFMQNGWKGFRYDDYPKQLHVINESLDLYPMDKEIRDISRQDLKKWLDKNLLFEDGKLTIDENTFETKFMPSDQTVKADSVDS